MRRDKYDSQFPCAATDGMLLLALMLSLMAMLLGYRRLIAASY